MKSAVVILLLSVSGIEKLELKTHGLNCNEIADAWMEVDIMSKYHGCPPSYIQPKSYTLHSLCRGPGNFHAGRSR